MADEPKVSLRRTAPGTHRPDPRELVQLRLIEIRKDFIDELLDDEIIKARRAREWGITRRSIARYLEVVKARYSRERTDADDAFRKMLEATLLANYQRQLATERAAREATTVVMVGGRALLTDDGQPVTIPDRQFKAEISSQRAQILAVERICILRGLDKQPPSKPPEGKENPFHLRARITAELAAGGTIPLADRKPEGSA